MQKTVKLLEIGEFNKQKAALLEEQVSLLKEQIELKSRIIKTYDEKDTTAARIIHTYSQEIVNLKEQLAMAMKEAKSQNKAMRQQKRKTVFVAIAGPALTAAAFIYLKK